MATAPAFAATPQVATVPVVTANTTRDGSGTIATLMTAGASGTKVEEIRIKADNDPADSIVVIYLYDGSNYAVFDEFDMGNPAAATATVTAYGESRTYENLILKSGWSLRASITAALTAGEINAFAFGGDF